VGSVLYFHPGVTVKEELRIKSIQKPISIQEVFTAQKKSTLTTIPLFKDNAFDYSDLLTWISPDLKKYTWLVFIPIVVFIIVAVTNGANLTDGIDGLAAGSSTIMVLVLGIFAWVSGNVIFSNYLNIMYIPQVGEVVIFVAAFSGALIGFLWYNTYPASVFMGDTGSLTIGGVIAVIALVVRKELLIPLLCGIFLIENLSVVIQVGYFKYTRKKTGIGKRIFKMAPLHHHYQKLGFHESKIVVRFWIIGILLAVLSIVTLKIR
jgi:phospho-N-acetylmuramoyl-pentapeptide-transferase